MTETLNLTRSINDEQMEAEREEFIERNTSRLGTVEIDIAHRALLAIEAEEKASKSLSQIEEFTD